jgi:hypothetical protein
MGVKPDFTILDELDKRQAMEQENISSARKRYYKLEEEERQKAAMEEATAKQLEVYVEHQEAIIKSGQFTNDITKGIQGGEKIEKLLLKAIECISLITGDSLFYELNKSNLKKAYGIDVEGDSFVEITSAEELEKYLE